MTKINKKILIFTHIADIDGMGSVVLSKLIFNKVDVVFCNPNDLDEKFLDYFKKDKFKSYDNIFITDVCINKDNLELVNNNSLKNKIMIIDHHPHKLKYLELFDFLRVKIKDKKGLCCASSLFYEYCLENNYITRKKNIDKFIELIRRNDTWEWKTIYNDKMSNDLSVLFKLLGKDSYIKIMVEKLSMEEEFYFSKEEQNFINSYQEKLDIETNNVFNEMIFKKIDNYNVGIAFINYEIRNELQEKVRSSKKDVDYLILISMETNKISFRRINNDVKLNLIAQKYGGNGHEASAGASITDEMKGKILNLILNKKNVDN